MAWLRFALLALMFSFVHSDARAQESGDTEAFAKRWVVVLGSFPDAGAASRAASARGEGLHVLTSARFTGFVPGYHVVFAGPYADRREAAAAAGVVEPSARGYIKFTGELRAAPEARAPVAPASALAPKPSKPASPVGRSFPAPDFLSEEQLDAIERWRRQAERMAGPDAQYQIVQVFQSFAAAAGGVLIRERVMTSTRCMLGYRELEFMPPEAGLELRTASVLGPNCCPGTACADRTPGGLMLELFESGRDPSWAIDAERGLQLDNMQGWSRHITRAQAKELEAFMSFDPSEDTFECAQTWTRGTARCFKYAAGKGYDFVWAKRPGGAVLERIVIAHRQ